MSFNVNQLKTFLNQDNPGKKGNLCKRSSYLCLYFPLCFIYDDTPFVVFAPSSVSMRALCVLFLNPKPHPSSISTPSVWVCHPPLLLLLVLWRALRNWSLKRGISKWRPVYLVVNETIWSRRFFITPFLPVDPPSLPPTTLAANWSMNLLPYPETPKAFHC